ncbi:helix-turn-helix transcriptional regulator [Lysobacter sp. CA199]|uniref:helix-turn-helix transcriptional regulator n=1 Tax=Lysobacter sp. CA199 TaxID=3455608 RepID=UPI003F8D67E4
MDARLIRAKTVMERTGLGRSTLYARAQAGTFPTPVALSRAMPGWVESEVQAWIDECIAQRDKRFGLVPRVRLVPAQLLRLKAVIEKTGMSRSSVYALGSGDAFPRPVPLGGGISAWVNDEIQAWIASRINLRNTKGASIRSAA